MDARLQHFINCLITIPQADYPMHSRVHPLRSFIFSGAHCYIKRDDELGFGISGSKIRKYRSLIPCLLQKNIQEVVVIGSAYSNHVLSSIQLLIENGLRPTLFLRGDATRSLQGNSLLTSLFVSPSSIHWFSKEEWKNVEIDAHTYAKKQPHSTFVLPEGGFTPEALPGALSLALDVHENEKTLGFTFDDLLIDAGTGFMASTLILALAWLQHPTVVHVVLLAEQEASFLARLKSCHEMFTHFMQLSSPFPQNFVLHLPQITKGFGQIHSSLFQTIAHLARTEGFLTDPIYTVKLLMESRHLLEKGEIKGNILIHHSGGALTLTGFQEHLHSLSLSSS